MTGARVETSDHGDLVHIAVAGEVDLANAETVSRQIEAAISNRAACVSLDLSGVGYLDSAGLRVLFSLADRLATLQIELELVAPVGSPARRVIELSGLEAVTSLHPPRGRSPSPPRPGQSRSR